MKKIIFLSVVSALFLSACSSKETKPNYDVEPTIQQQNSKEALKDL